MQLVRVSPKGQITIPKNVRDTFVNKQLMIECKGKSIVLHTVVIQFEQDEVKDFSALAKPSFDFWEDDSDDVYQKFYSDKK